MYRSNTTVSRLILYIIILTACADLRTAHAPASTVTSNPSPNSAPTSSPTPGVSATSPPGNTPVLRFHSPDLVHDLAWSPDGGLLAVSAGTGIHIYKASDLAEQYTLPVGVWAERIAFHPALPLLAAASKDGRIHFWDTADGAEVCAFVAHAKGANSLALQPHGTLLATTGTDIISRLWDISALPAGCDVTQSAELIGSSFTAPDVAFSPDGKSFALVDIRNIRLRASATRKLIATLKSDLPVFDLAFSPDGHWLAAAQGSATLALWDLTVAPTPGVTMLQLPTKDLQAYTWRVDFSSDGRLLAGGASDGSLQVWDLTTLQPLFSHALPGAVSALAFRPGTRLLAAATLDGGVYFWDIQ